MNSTMNQDVKNILDNLFRAKLIPVDAAGAIAGIQDGREKQRASMIAERQQILGDAGKVLTKLAADRSAQEGVVEKAKAVLKEEQEKLNAIVAEQTGTSNSSEARAGRLARGLRELSDPLYAQTLLELVRVSELARHKFAGGTWKVEAVHLGAKAARERIEQLQIESRPDDLSGYLTQLVEPVETAARDLGIQTCWPWASAVC